MQLRRYDPIPLYHQLAEEIREQIESQQLPAGERIPSLQELARQYKVSYMTERHAIGELVRQGLLEARQGVGTFVALPKIDYDLRKLTGFTEDMHARGLAPHARLLDLVLEPARERIAQKLQIPPGEKIVHVARLRYSGDLPAVLDDSYLPSSLCPALENEDLEHTSLYSLLEGPYGLVLDHAVQVIETTGANRYEAELLGVPVGAAMMLVRGVTYLADGRPVEYYKNVYRGDRFRFQLDAVRLHK
jgi:GntR family transcriptional regulator